jgi:hypothetical protein
VSIKTYRVQKQNFICENCALYGLIRLKSNLSQVLHNPGTVYTEMVQDSETKLGTNTEPLWRILQFCAMSYRFSLLSLKGDAYDISIVCSPASPSL